MRALCPACESLSHQSLQACMHEPCTCHFLMFALPKYVHAFCGDCLIYQALDGFTRAYIVMYTSLASLLLLCFCWKIYTFYVHLYV